MERLLGVEALAGRCSLRDAPAACYASPLACPSGLSREAYTPTVGCRDVSGQRPHGRHHVDAALGEPQLKPQVQG